MRGRIALQSLREPQRRGYNCVDNVAITARQSDYISLVTSHQSLGNHGITAADAESGGALALPSAGLLRWLSP